MCVSVSVSPPSQVEEGLGETKLRPHESSRTSRTPTSLTQPVGPLSGRDTPRAHRRTLRETLASSSCLSLAPTTLTTRISPRHPPETRRGKGGHTAGTIATDTIAGSRKHPTQQKCPTRLNVPSLPGLTGWLAVIRSLPRRPVIDLTGSIQTQRPCVTTSRAVADPGEECHATALDLPRTGLNRPKESRGRKERMGGSVKTVRRS